MRVFLAPFTVLLPNFLRRYEDIRRRGHGHARSITLLILHLPWFLTYAVSSYTTLRAHETAGTVDRLVPRLTVGDLSD
jgi:hypothetical protein